MKIAIGSDHTGIELRKKIIEDLQLQGYNVIDCGSDKEKSDYATQGLRVAENVSMGNGDFGIVICGTGIGISIAANKVKTIRAALIDNEESARLARMHNNANVIALGARVIDFEQAKKMIEAFLTNKFEGGRHLDRIDTISDYEESCYDC